MAAKYWIKLYHEILDDPKMGMLPDNVYRRCIELFLLAGRIDNDGKLPDTIELAWMLRQNPETFEAEMHHLERVNIVTKTESGWVVTKFADRQSPVDSTQRSRYFRSKLRNDTATIRPNKWDVPKKWAYGIYKDMPEKGGIYRISCVENGSSYIGSSINLRNRIKQHLSEIKTTSHHRLFNEFAEYGPKSIRVEVLEIVNDESLLPDKETYWMKNYDNLKNVEQKGKNHRDRNATNRCTDTDTDTDITIVAPEKAPAGRKSSQKAPKGAGDKSPSQPKKMLMGEFQAITGLKMPGKSGVGFWWASIAEILEIANGDIDCGKRLIRDSYHKLSADNLTISGPNSLVKTCRAMAARPPNGNGHVNTMHLTPEQEQVAAQLRQLTAAKTLEGADG